MNDDQLLRYSRQILLPEIDVEGQQRLLDARVLIVGLGGLGSPVAMYLAAAGVGQLVLVDFDRVELSNLQRQVIHGTADIGRLKVGSANERVLELNPDCDVTAIPDRFTAGALIEQVDRADVVVDASDDFSTRFAINEACFETRTPLVSGAAIRFEGQISVFRPGCGSSPCYACLYGDVGVDAQTCTQTGVAAPLLGIIGSVQAMETLKLLTGAGASLEGRLVCLDALQMRWHSVDLRRDPQCRVCGETSRLRHARAAE